MTDDRPEDIHEEGDRPDLDRLIRAGFGTPKEDRKSAVDRLRAALGEARVAPAGDGEERYAIGEVIGRGGVGAVYRGTDHNLDRDVAIKILAEEHAHNADLAERFVDEARIAGRLEHPGVVPVHEVGHRPDGRPFFSMKLVEGATLSELLASRTGLRDDRRRFLMIFEKVCETLAYAHAHGVVHRDVKPSNVMVGSFGEVQLMDWGLAKVLAAPERTKIRPASEITETGDTARGSTAGRSETGSVMGTPPYMPPEQARGDVAAIDRRTDVFALGALLCEILTGKPPYTGSQADVRRQARDGDLAAAYERIADAGIEPELLGVLRAALVADPDARLPDAKALAARFAAYREGRDERLRKAELVAARAKIRVGLIVTLALLAVTVAVSWAWYDRERIRQANAAGERVATSLTELGDLRRAARGTLDPQRWLAVLAAAERTDRTLAGEHVDASLRARTMSRLAQIRDEAEQANEAITRVTRDRAMTAALDHARLVATDPRDERPGLFYQDAFADYGIDVDALTVDAAAERIRASAITDALIAGLDGWTMIEQRTDMPRARRLFEIVELADPDPERHRARIALLQGDHDTLVEVGKTLDVTSAPPETVVLVAHRLLRIGETAIGHRLLLRAVDERPGEFWIHEQLSRATGVRDADATLRLRHCEALRALRPDSADVWLRVGEARLADGDRDGAARAIRRALELDPDSAQAHFALASVADPDDRVARIRAIRAALALDDRSPFWHVDLGRLLAENGDDDDARAAFEAAVERMPKNLQALEWLGKLAMRARDMDTADRWMHQLVDAGRETLDVRKSIDEIHRRFGYDPRRALAFAAFHLAERASQRGDLVAAMALYRQSEAWFPVNQIAAGKLAIALISIGAFEEAETVARRSIETQRDFPLAQAALGNALEKQGRYDEAQTLYEGAIDGAKKIGVRSNAPAIMLRQLEQKLGRVEAVDALVGGGDAPDDAEECVHLAAVAVERGHLQLGASLYRRALDDDEALGAGTRQTALIDGGTTAILLAASAGAPDRDAWRTRGIAWLTRALDAWKPLLGGKGDGAIRARVAALALDRRLESLRGDARARHEAFWRLIESFAASE